MIVLFPRPSIGTIGPKVILLGSVQIGEHPIAKSASHQGILVDLVEDFVFIIDNLDQIVLVKRKLFYQLGSQISQAELWKPQIHLGKTGQTLFLEYAIFLVQPDSITEFQLAFEAFGV